MISLGGKFGRLGHLSSYSSSASFSIHSNPGPQHCAKPFQETDGRVRITSGSWVKDGLWVQSPKPNKFLVQLRPKVTINSAVSLAIEEKQGSKLRG